MKRAAKVVGVWLAVQVVSYLLFATVFAREPFMFWAAWGSVALVSALIAAVAWAAMVIGSRSTQALAPRR